MPSKVARLETNDIKILKESSENIVITTIIVAVLLIVARVFSSPLLLLY